LDGYQHDQRAQWPSRAHSSVDRKRNENDRLGRSYRRRLGFENRRQILRRWTESDTHANTFSNPNRDSYCYTHANSHRYADGNGDSAASIANPDGDRNCNSNAERDSETYAHAQVSTYAAAAPDAGTSTVMDAGLATESFCPNVHFR
jgi:hypothetical protein